MVRLGWHVEEGIAANIPVGGLQLDSEAGVQHATCEIQGASSSGHLQCIFTLPARYHVDGTTSTVGVLLAHGDQADTFRGRLLTQLATCLAQAGHVAVRYHCPGKESRRARVLERVLDAAATSPYTRNTTRWVLAGIGSGARICASIGSRCRAQVAGYLLMAYPLLEPLPGAKHPGSTTNSSGPLLSLTTPVLLIQPSNDPLGPVEQVLEAAKKVPSYDVRMVQVQGVDGAFRDAERHAPPSEPVRQQLCSAAARFVQALANGSLEECGESLPRIKHGMEGTPGPAAPPQLSRPPLSLSPFHLLAQQHMRLASGGATHNISQLPPQVVSLLFMSQQQQKAQQELLDSKLQGAAGAGPGAAPVSAAAAGAGAAMQNGVAAAAAAGAGDAEGGAAGTVPLSTTAAAEAQGVAQAPEDVTQAAPMDADVPGAVKAEQQEAAVLPASGPGTGAAEAGAAAAPMDTDGAP